MSGGMTGWDEITCQRGHEQHDTKEVVIHLGGGHGYHDYPSIPRRFSDRFEMEIWDPEKYPVDHGVWCPAHDTVSETIDQQRIWEPCETILMLEAFRYCDTFIDIGSQLGWFSILAARAGLDVVAIEADPIVAEVCERNIERNLQDTNVSDVRCRRVQSDVPPLLLPLGDDRVAVKIDIEGNEADAVKMLEHVMDGVDFMLIEISPCFNDTYPDLVCGLIEGGFNAYLVPEKSMPPARLQELPEDLVIWDLGGDLEEVRATVAGWRQQNVLFVRDGVW